MHNQQYNAYFEKQRRLQSQYAYVRQAVLSAKISNLAKFIAAGGAAEDSPDYEYLVDEIGLDALVTEIGQLIEREDSGKRGQ